MGGVTLDSETNQNKTRIIYEDGNGSDTTTVIPKEGGKLSTGNHLSGLVPYHLLEGDLTLTNTVEVNGFSSTIHTGNGTSITVNTGVDMVTQHGTDVSEKYGGLTIIKSRSIVAQALWFDTLRGPTNFLASGGNAINVTAANTVTSFNNNGITIGSSGDLNTNAATFVSYSFQTTHRRNTVSNHGMTIEEHYNPSSGFGMVKFTGSGTTKHELLHSLGRKIDFAIIKNITSVADWRVESDVIDSRMLLNKTDSRVGYSYLTHTDKSISIESNHLDYNAANNTYVIYYWCNSYLDIENRLIGNYEVGYYNGKGTVGNEIKTRAKPALIMIKRVDVVGDWIVYDLLRNSGLTTNLNKALYLNSNAVEVDTDATATIYTTIDSFVLQTVSGTLNASNGKYVYLVVYDNDNSSGKSKYTKTTTNSTVNINNALVPFAEGISSGGSSRISTIIKNEVIPSLNYVQGKNYPYLKNNGTYDVTKFNPNYDNYNGFGDYFDSKTNTWYKDVNVFFDDFSSGTINPLITKDANVNLSISNNRLVITESVAGYYYAYLNIGTLGLIPGKKYRFNINTIGTRLLYSTYNGVVLYYNYLTKDKNYGEFTYVQGVDTINISDSSANSYPIYIDEISITPLNVDGSIDVSNGVEITESRNYLNHIVNCDHNGKIVYIEKVSKSEYKKDLVVSDKLTLQDIKSIESNKEIPFEINGKKQLTINEDGSLVNQDGNALSTGGFKNYIINGNFDFWQRGQNITTGYFADRWLIVSGFSDTSKNVSSAPSGAYTSGYLRRSVTGAMSFCQRIEGVNIKNLIGKKATLSFNQKLVQGSVGAIVIEFFTANALDNFTTSTSIDSVTFTNPKDGKLTFTTPFFLPETIVNGLEVRITFNVIGDTAVTINQVQFEEGTVATPFEDRPIGLELALCKRYYQTSLDDISFTADSNTLSTQHTSNAFPLGRKFLLPVAMRTLPTVSYTSLTTGYTGGTPTVTANAVCVMLTLNPTITGVNNPYIYVSGLKLDAEL